MVWTCRQFTFRFPRRALVMGILNVTPDSFSDGGRYLELSAAVDRARVMVEEGADLVDVGGESTRPGAPEVEESEELRRVLPVVERLASDLEVPVSIDTRKPAVAARAVAAGASVVNDVAAGRDDALLWDLLRESGAGYVVMHMQGEPGTMQAAPHYDDVCRDIGAFFHERTQRLESTGVRREQLILDPGIGFGKTLEHNLELIAHLDRLTVDSRPLLLGVSRKSFLGRLLDAPTDDRLPGGLACTAWAALQGVQVFRTHDVRPTVQLLQTLESIREHRRRAP